MTDLSLVMPFYNEEKNVKKVLENTIRVLKKNKVDFEILAVNNGSRDNTQFIILELIKKNKKIRLIEIKKNKGYGFGIISGLKFSKCNIVGFMDGDGQISAESMFQCYKVLKENPRYQVSKTYRTKREDGLKRDFLSVGFNFLLSTLFGINSKDINSCPKLMRRECYKCINPVSYDWFIDAEILIKAKKFKYQVKEIPAVFSKRKKGNSNVYGHTIWEFISNILKWRIRTIFLKEF